MVFFYLFCPYCLLILELVVYQANRLRETASYSSNEQLMRKEHSCLHTDLSSCISRH
jgi:hypothetical protein